MPAIVALAVLLIMSPVTFAVEEDDGVTGTIKTKARTEDADLMAEGTIAADSGENDGAVMESATAGAIVADPAKDDEIDEIMEDSITESGITVDSEEDGGAATGPAINSAEESIITELFGEEMAVSREPITREAFLAVVAKVTCRGETTSDITMPFVDVEEVSEALLPYVKQVYMRGLLAGVKKKDGLYIDPKAILTRQDACAILGRALGVASGHRMQFSDEATVAMYAYAYVSGLTTEEIVNGYPDGTFRPKSSLSYKETDILAGQVLALNQTLRTIAGGETGGYQDGASLQSQMTEPKGMGFYSNGVVLVADTYNSLLRRVNMGSVSTVSGYVVGRDENGYSEVYCVDSSLRESFLARPYDVVFDASGSLVFTDMGNNAVKIAIDGNLYTLSGGQGSNQSGYQEGGSEEALYNQPTGLVSDQNNNIYVADTKNHCIRKIDTNGNSSLFAGTPGQSGYQDGDGDLALFNEPIGLDIDEAGNIYVADSRNQRIRVIAPDGTVSTLAGSGEQYVEFAGSSGFFLGGNTDGPALEARFNLPKGVCVVGDVVFVADSYNDAIRMIRDGRVTTVLGEEMHMKRPTDVGYRDGKLYVVDSENNQIRMIYLAI